MLLRAAATSSICAVLISFSASAEEYVPKSGDKAVIYLNKFKPDDFAEAKEIMVNGFGQAMSNSGQSRHTYFLENPDNNEILTISFFEEGSDVDQWHDNSGRVAVLKQLAPLRSQPVAISTFELVDSHNIAN